MMTLLALASVAAVLAVPLGAQTIRLEADIPFGFVAGNTTMPAGGYSITAGSTGFPPDSLTIRATNGHSFVVVQVNRLEKDKTPEQPRLVFRRYGNQYLLSRVWGSALSGGREVRESRIERELAKTASMLEAETVILLAKR